MVSAFVDSGIVDDTARIAEKWIGIESYQNGTLIQHVAQLILGTAVNSVDDVGSPVIVVTLAVSSEVRVVVLGISDTVVLTTSVGMTCAMENHVSHHDPLDTHGTTSTSRGTVLVKHTVLSWSQMMMSRCVRVDDVE